MPQFSAQGRLHKHASGAGSASEVDIIAAVQITADPDPSLGNQALVTSFAATAADGTANNIFRLKVSTDGAAYTTVDTIVIPSGGTVLLTYRGSDKDNEGILVKKGKYFKVTYQQTTIGVATATMLGFTAASDIVDAILA